MKRYKRRNSQKDMAQQSQKGEMCARCGKPELNPVANMFKGRIEWICYECYKKVKK